MIEMTTSSSTSVNASRRPLCSAGIRMAASLISRVASVGRTRRLATIRDLLRHRLETVAVVRRLTRTGRIDLHEHLQSEFAVLAHRHDHWLAVVRRSQRRIAGTGADRVDEGVEDRAIVAG